MRAEAAEAALSRVFDALRDDSETDVTLAGVERALLGLRRRPDVSDSYRRQFAKFLEAHDVGERDPIRAMLRAGP